MELCIICSMGTCLKRNGKPLTKQEIGKGVKQIFSWIAKIEGHRLRGECVCVYIYKTMTSHLAIFDLSFKRLRTYVML